jgi:hypothetical protein
MYHAARRSLSCGMHHNPSPLEAIGLGYLPDELLPSTVPLPLSSDDDRRLSSDMHRDACDPTLEAIGLGYLPDELLPSPPRRRARTGPASR